MKIWEFNNFIIHEFDELESTNSLAFQLASEKKSFDREVILASSQTAGKGSNSRFWHSPAGNLYFSIILKPKADSQKVTDLSLLVIHVLIDVIKKISGADKISATAKHPNDLLLNGRKAAGCLLESKINQNEIDFVILGVGVNIESNPDDANVIFPATNLKKCGINIEPKDFLKKFLDQFDIVYGNWLNYGNSPTNISVK